MDAEHTVKVDCGSGENAISYDFRGGDTEERIDFQNVGEFLLVIRNDEPSLYMRSWPKESAEAAEDLLAGATMSVFNSLLALGMGEVEATMSCLVGFLRGLDCEERDKAVSVRPHGGRLVSDELASLAEELGVDLPDES